MSSVASKRLYLSPLLVHGVPMLASVPKPRFMAPHELAILTDESLDTLSWVANELFDIAYATNRFRLAHDVGQLVTAIDREQERREKRNA